MIDIVECIHSGKEAGYSSIALSRVAMQRKQDDIAQQLKLSLQAKINKKESLLSLAVDELTDINDSALLLIFVRSFSSSFDLCKNFLSMETLATHTRGEDIFIGVKNACIRSGLDLKYLRGICTDGAPATTGNQQGFVTRFLDYVSNEYDNKKLINLYSIIHQEALCAKSIAFITILKDVNCNILFFRANALHHPQFREISCSSETSAEDILYHSAVRWLSIGENSCRVLQMRKEIVEYYSTKNKECPLLDKDFLISLGFLVNFLTQVNFLNQSLQGKATTVCFVCKKVQHFCDKCCLLKGHLHQRNFFHFPQMKALIDSKEIQVDDIPIILFSSVFDGVLQEFSNRFRDFEKISDTTRLVAYAHVVETETAPLNLQMELVELKKDEQFVKKFKDEEDLLDTWKEAVKYRNL